jgi:hypothetical protein
MEAIARQTQVDRRDHARHEYRAPSFRPPHAPAWRSNNGCEPIEIGSIGRLFELAGFVDCECTLEEKGLVDHHCSETVSVFERQIREMSQSIHPGERSGRIEPEPIGLPVARCDRLPARRAECGGILANLGREIDQGDDHADAADEITKISECVENADLLPAWGFEAGPSFE